MSDLHPPHDSALTLDEVFAPHSTDTFIARLERGPWHVQGRHEAHYARLFSRRELVTLLWQQGAQLASRVYVHRDGRTRYLPAAFRDRPWEWLADAYREGCTIVVNDVSRCHVGVAGLCNALGQVLGAVVHANAFLAPPDVPGYAAHFDCDDTLFLQLEGGKRWTLHAPVIALPLAAQQAGIDPATLGHATVIDLAAGDLLYLPRGHIHAAHASPAGSLHLTLGIAHVLWRDIVQLAIAEAATRDPRLHARVNPGEAREVAPLLKDILSRLRAPAEVARLRARVQSMHPAKPPPSELFGR